MSDDYLEDVRLRKRANVYYDGRVTSRELRTPDGERRTLGVVLPGTYTFETDETETIEILAGSGKIELSAETVVFGPGDTVTVPAQTSFDFVADDVVDYCCTYD
ncbi:pyrimidine/purine nucleoside phosphorylase [Halospeciosus flavus]|uniref:Pyrimidine/purine nucleoside phosphorylase n=1 Tax=Halospeciosus flavus TaxID=3032283 RepID=A0ABD5Z0Q3_9EURY|nr:pyrimidine/purine nucleoside phosphorylase [Halospeciosus flavus]